MLRHQNPTVTLSTLTGQGFSIDGRTVTTGDIAYLYCDASLTTGNFIKCFDTGSSTTKFQVEEDGAVTIAGTAAVAIAARPKGCAMFGATH